MADTTTTNYSLTKPEIGASEDDWGDKLNTNADTIDAQLKNNADAASTADGKAVTAQSGADLSAKKASNLSDLADAATARTNLGLGTAATTASTAYATAAQGAKADSAAPLGSPALTGSPTAPTAPSGDNSTNIATTAFVAGAQSPSAVPDLLIQAVYSDNTAQTAVTAGEKTMPLNTIQRNLLGASLSSNKINGLAAGDYYIQANVLLRSLGDKILTCHLRDVDTDTALVLGGRSEGDYSISTLLIEGVFTVISGHEIDVRANSNASFVDGPARLATLGEDYVTTSVKIWAI